LRPQDRFNVLLFAAASAQFSPRSIEANKENLAMAFDFIDRQEGQGSTLLLPALKRALDMPHDDNYSRTVVIATDGYVTVEKESFDLIRENLGEANFFPFGIGPSVNRYIIEGMARAGGGAPLIITNQLEANAQALKFRKYIESPVLTNIKIDYDGFDVYDVEPKSYPDIFSERPLIVFGKYRGDAKGKVMISGLSGDKKFSRTMNVKEFASTDNNEALSYLWARNKIMTLSDYNSVARNEELKNEITRLGLKYNLLTEFTSFVGVDERNRMKEVVKTSSGAVPEPHEWMLMALVAATVLYFAVRRA
ncbi:MAG: trypsin, partial [Bacteroidia bacterium]|nr:trypsin [Bacteroidia bacterium]